MWILSCVHTVLEDSTEGLRDSAFSCSHGYDLLQRQGRDTQLDHKGQSHRLSLETFMWCFLMCSFFHEGSHSTLFPQQWKCNNICVRFLPRKPTRDSTPTVYIGDLSDRHPLLSKMPDSRREADVQHKRCANSLGIVSHPYYLGKVLCQCRNYF